MFVLTGYTVGVHYLYATARAMVRERATRHGPCDRSWATPRARHAAVASAVQPPLFGVHRVVARVGALLLVPSTVFTDPSSPSSESPSPSRSSSPYAPPSSIPSRAPPRCTPCSGTPPASSCVASVSSTASSVSRALHQRRQALGRRAAMRSGVAPPSASARERRRRTHRRRQTRRHYPSPRRAVHTRQALGRGTAERINACVSLPRARARADAAVMRAAAVAHAADATILRRRRAPSPTRSSVRGLCALGHRVAERFGARAPPPPPRAPPPLGCHAAERFGA
jgi:hypothetical protein